MTENSSASLSLSVSASASALLGEYTRISQLGPYAIQHEAERREDSRSTKRRYETVELGK